MKRMRNRTGCCAMNTQRQARGPRTEVWMMYNAYGFILYSIFVFCYLVLSEKDMEDRWKFLFLRGGIIFKEARIHFRRIFWTIGKACK